MEENMPEEKRGRGWYDRSYMWFLLVPAILLVISIVYLFNFNMQQGDLIYKDVSLTGGTSVTVLDAGIDIGDLKNRLKSEFPDLVVRGISDFVTGKQRGVSVETKADADSIKGALEKYLGYDLTQDNSSIEFSGSTLSRGFYQQLRLAILIAFIFMAIVVFLIFKTFVPSFAVVLSAFADIIMTVFVVDAAGMQVSIAGIVAFLMLIGYSVDTDILLTSRLLKSREGTLNQRIYGAFKTGITMTLTSIAAAAVSLVIIYNLSDTLRQIFSIILIGLGFDILNTWITNAGILKWYVERKEGRG